VTESGERDPILAPDYDELLSMHHAVLADAARYRALFDVVPTALIVTDANLTVREANGAAARLLEIDARFLLGKPLTAYVELASRRTMRRWTRELRRAGGSAASLRLRRRTGVTFDAAVHVAAVGDEVYWAIADRTAEAQAEARLWELNRELERRAEEHAAALHAVVEQLPVGIVVLTADGRVSWMNEHAQELVGHRTRGLPLRDERGRPIPAAQRPGARALAGETVADLRALVTRPDGRDAVVHVTAAPISSPPGGAAVVLFDATVRDRIERADVEFVQNAAHQLRNPITAIAASVAALEAGASEDAHERGRFLEHIRRESERMGLVVEALLTMAGLQRGGARPLLEVIPLRKVVADALDFAGVLDGVKVDVDCGDGLAVVGDSDLLVQSIGNVLANAAEHTNGGRVTVTGRLDEPMVVLEVTDYGPGVAPEARDRVFDRFFRSGPSARRGSGLGLAIAHAAARSALSSLELLPQRAGEGATFRFTMPGARLR
jgi:PAS domain S-box-containing protein